MKSQSIRISAFAAALAAFALVSCSSAPHATETSNAQQKLALTPVKDPRAMAELKQMSDALTGASSMSFVANSMTPFQGPNGQWVHAFATAKVEMQRPDHAFIETGGDAFPQKIYYDGHTFSTHAMGEHLYSKTEMHGTIDDMLAQAARKGGMTFAFADVLISDPLASWTKDLDGALYIGDSTRGGEKLRHLAFTAKGVDWEMWVDMHSHLPRAVYVKYTGARKSPSVLIEFSKWKLNSKFSAADFTFKAPKGAKMAALKAPEGTRQ